MKNYKKKIITTTLLTLFPMLIGFLLYSKLPDQLAIHFNFQGTPDSFANKFWVICGLPCFLALIHLIAIGITLHDPKKSEIGQKMLSVIFYLIPVLSLFILSMTYLFALDSSFNMVSGVMILLGFLFLVLGNYLSKTHQNYTVGIRLPWTLNNRENWNQTHRFSSKLYMLGGLAIFINAFFRNTIFFFVVLAILLIVPCLYSFILYKKESQ